jgi:hypothetical protein
VRNEQELAGCIDETPATTARRCSASTSSRSRSRDPAEARIVDSPAVFADPEQGAWPGCGAAATTATYAGDRAHRPVPRHHRVSRRRLAAGACSGNGILFDISDPLNPKRIDEVVDRALPTGTRRPSTTTAPRSCSPTSGAAASRARCRAHDPLTWGANAIYDIVDGKLEFRSHFKMPAPQTEQENCVAHNGSIVPVPGRDIFVQAWYQGGISVIDFTDSARPVEIAYFDRGPIDAEDLVVGGYWSAYWYKGRIYGTEIVRGLDVLALLPSEHLTANEIAAAALADQGALFNPQQQFRVTWPAEPVVARAYLDQLPGAPRGRRAARLSEYPLPAHHGFTR